MRTARIRRGAVALIGALVLFGAGSCQGGGTNAAPGASTTTTPGTSTTPTPTPTSAAPTTPVPSQTTTPTPQQSTPKPTVTVPPTTSPTVPASLRGKDVEVIPTSGKVVALTFDAGANADGLASILATLNSRHVPATFFLTGNWATTYPSLVRQLVAGGYRLGNHTVTHPHLPTMSDAAIVNELATARSKIMAAGGTDPKPFFRFPYGDRTAHTITVVNNAGYVAVRWTVDSLGWEGTSGGITTQTVINRVVGAARPGEIVLMHVGSNPTDHTTLDASALPTVITKLSALGYSFVTLNALLGGAAPVIPAGCDTLSWRTAPLSVTHAIPVPPVPVVTGIRTGAHPECRFDRLVFDLTGPTPSYELRYVTSVTADPSDKPVTVAGARYLLVVLHPAQGHTDAGVPTIYTRSVTVSYPMLKGYAVAGDFEGYVTVALGLANTACAGELSGRLYIDVSY